MIHTDMAQQELHHKAQYLKDYGNKGFYRELCKAEAAKMRLLDTGLHQKRYKPEPLQLHPIVTIDPFSWTAFPSVAHVRWAHP